MTAQSSWVGRCDGCGDKYDEASYIQADGKRFCSATCYSDWEDAQLARVQEKAAEQIDAGQTPTVKFGFWPPISWFAIAMALFQ